MFSDHYSKKKHNLESNLAHTSILNVSQALLKPNQEGFLLFEL